MEVMAILCKDDLIKKYKTLGDELKEKSSTVNELQEKCEDLNKSLVQGWCAAFNVHGATV